MSPRSSSAVPTPPTLGPTSEAAPSEVVIVAAAEESDVYCRVTGTSSSVGTDTGSRTSTDSRTDRSVAITAVTHGSATCQTTYV
jgi:hypothetical protein